MEGEQPVWVFKISEVYSLSFSCPSMTPYFLPLLSLDPSLFPLLSISLSDHLSCLCIPLSSITIGLSVPLSVCASVLVF